MTARTETPLCVQTLRLIAQKGSLTVPELMIALQVSKPVMTGIIHSLRKYGSVRTLDAKRDGYLPYFATEKGLARLARRDDAEERRKERERIKSDLFYVPPRDWEPLDVARRVPSFVFNIGASA